jgi:hypothetical protein
MMALRARAAVAEEVEAGERGILGLTAAVGSMAAAASAARGDALWLVIVPTASLLALLLARRTPAAAVAGVAVWLCFVGHASGEALVVPLAMALVCLALAVGPDRVVGILGAVTLRTDEGGGPGGWIEDEPSR